jgi:hypothetical protein
MIARRATARERRNEVRERLARAAEADGRVRAPRRHSAPADREECGAAVDRAVPGAEAGLQWRELRNKLEIYLPLENAATRLRVSRVERTPLPEPVERAYALGPFLALWAEEGLGHIYGEQALRDTPTPRALLTGPASDAARPGALLMLHAGIGRAFAQRLFDVVTPANTATALRPALRELVALCRDNSRPGYVGATYESLGLVTRTFHQELVAAVDRGLQEAAEDLLGYFWHGVGRAILSRGGPEWSLRPTVSAGHP